MNQESRRQMLGGFLCQCRGRLQPKDVGLPSTKRRRTPGLRREEVAVLAGISQTYYVKIEQGRLDVSPHVLDSISKVLKLNWAEKEYAYGLATGHTKYNNFSFP